MMNTRRRNLRSSMRWLLLAVMAVVMASSGAGTWSNVAIAQMVPTANDSIHVEKTRVLPNIVDDATFLGSLRQRGLCEWIEQFGRDVDASGDDVDSEVAAALFQREMLLIESARPGATAEEVHASIDKADNTLSRLITAHPEHPGRFVWQLELARDLLERQRPELFDTLLTYEMPSAEPATMQRLADAAVEQAMTLRQEIAAAWKSVETLDEAGLLAVRTTGSLAMLESLDAQSTMVLAWARLYQELSREINVDVDVDVAAQPASVESKEQADQKSHNNGTPSRSVQPGAGFEAVLADVTKSGWLDLPPGREVEQAGALLVAAIAERHLGRTTQADAHARQIIALLDRKTDRAVRQRLNRTILLAILEQIRVARDSGQVDVALTAAGQARQWCLKSRPDDVAALVAVTMLEAHVLHCKAIAANTAATKPVMLTKGRMSPRDWLTQPECLKALDQLARRSIAHRDLLYHLLAPILAESPTMAATSTSTGTSTNLSPTAVQMLLGASVARVAQMTARDGSAVVVSDILKSPKETASDERFKPLLEHLRSAIQAGRAACAFPEVMNDPFLAGELRYLIGVGLSLTQARSASSEAQQVLIELVEKQPMHDRADSAASRAVSLAADDVRRSGPSGSPASRAMYIQAARLCRQRMQARVNTNTADKIDGNAGVAAHVAELTFSIGVALENDGRFEQAVTEYAAVPAGHARWSDAALGQIRCWRQLLVQTSAAGGSIATTANTMTTHATMAEAIAQIKAGVRTISQVSENLDESVRARLTLAIAELLNEPALEASEESARLLDGFDRRFPNCSELQGPALWQRIVALRQLKQLKEAAVVLDRYLTADPEHAGPTIVGLLKAVYDEMIESLRRGDEPTAAMLAGETISLGQSLMDWVRAHPGKIATADLIVVEYWYVVGLLQAERFAEALAVVEQVEREKDMALNLNGASGARVDWQLARADALLGLDRPTEALPIYTELWPKLAEASEAWWHALTGNLRCHARLDQDATVVLQSIRQQRFVFPEFDKGIYQHQLNRLEQSLQHVGQW